MSFTLEDAKRANDEWGANCGPAALAAILGITLADVRPLMGDFEKKGYTNPTLMLDCLKRSGVAWSKAFNQFAWPQHGLVRIQWEGPWTEPGVPMRARYRNTHWVGARTEADARVTIFDVNALCIGGWIPFSQWAQDLVPWLLKTLYPTANGKWHLTHVLEVAVLEVAT
jgi:hypothetical protein